MANIDIYYFKPILIKHIKNIKLNFIKLTKQQSISSVQLYFNHSLGTFIYYTFNGRSTLFHFVNVVEDPVGKKTNTIKIFPSSLLLFHLHQNPI